MKKFSFVFILAAILGGLIYASPAYAQAEPTPAPEPWMGEVTGRLINMNKAEENLGEVELMLHAWDQSNIQKLMMHGQTEGDGSFSFSDVPLEAGVYYSVMAIYQDANYFSPPLLVDSGREVVDLNVPIYETKNDLGGAQIEQMHVLFYSSQGGLGVTEVYVLSNLSDRTIRESVYLEEIDQYATVKFPLPPAASNISFDHENQSRFLTYSDGFADSAPLTPGKGTGQIVLSYILPYQDSLAYIFSQNLPTVKVNFLLEASSGLSLEGNNLITTGRQALETGAEFVSFEHGMLQPQDEIVIQLKGTPSFIMSGNEGAVGENQSGQKIRESFMAVFGLILGVLMILAGGWWIRKSQTESKEGVVTINGNNLDAVIAKIARLDQLREDQDVPENEYHQVRSALLKEAKSLLDQESSTL